jgi:hypothetical protein
MVMGVRAIVAWPSRPTALGYGYGYGYGIGIGYGIKRWG